MNKKEKIMKKNSQPKAANQIANRILLLSGSLLFVLSSCTKEVPFKALPPEEKVESYDKTLFDTQSEYLYSSSQQMSSLSSEEGFPFYSSDNKRVKIRMTEKTMQLIEIERDQRFSANSNNDKLVLEIPIEHQEFQCAKDNFGECTNKEENSKDIPWQQRKSVKIDAKEVKSGQLELLPLIDYSNMYTGCHQEVNSELVSSKVEPDAINFQIKKTFKVAAHCIGNINTLSDATVSAVYHYSLVKVNSVISKDYKTISYPISSKDEQSFGFFSTSKHRLDVDFSPTDKSRTQIMNRWNPNRKVIDYYLSDEFAKPENKMISDLTFASVDKLNNGLAEAGVNFRINLQQGQGKVPGDIRNSMIVLVEDPVAASVIGYGPQTEDPVTGEIISARTIMFLGTIKTSVKSTYANILDAKKIKAAEVKQKAATPAPGQTFSLPNRITTKYSSNLAEAAEKNPAKINSSKKFGVNKVIAEINAKKIELDSQVISNPSLALSKEFSKIKNELKNYKKIKNEDYILSGANADSNEVLKKRFKYQQEVKNCAFRIDANGLSASISQRLMDKFEDDAKPWDQLSDDKKQEVINIILPEVWGVTLIHELGHNLGLRHNFQGSEDKANFFSESELAEKGIDHVVPFSTVMEYGDDLKALPVLGKYDIAALRFGYNREVEIVTEEGVPVSVVKIPDTLESLKLEVGTKVKDYGFCTDEHTGINAGCRRFDLGTSYTEIVQNMITEYEDFYKLRNFRNGREDMSLMGDLAYAARIDRTFSDLRTMLEVKERLKYRFNLADDRPEWTQIAWLKDLRDASILAGQHLVKVIAVPDVTCIVADASKLSDTSTFEEKLNAVVGVLNINDIDPSAISCFKLELSAQYKVIAQAGKMFNSKKDPESTNSYADQIDVRGYWIDKLMATRQLLSRQTGQFTFDESNNDSFLNVAEVRTPMLDLFSNIMNNNVEDLVEFTFDDGVKASFKIPYDLEASQIIKKHFYTQIRDVDSRNIVLRRLGGLNSNGPTRLQQRLMEVLASNAKDLTEANPQDTRIGPAVSVSAFKKTDNIALVKGSLKLDLGENINEKTLDAIIAAKTSGAEVPATLPAEIKAIFELDISELNEYKDGILKPALFYKNMIQILPNNY
jgi:Met-zincin